MSGMPIACERIQCRKCSHNHAAGAVATAVAQASMTGGGWSDPPAAAGAAYKVLQVTAVRWIGSGGVAFAQRRSGGPSSCDGWVVAGVAAC